MPKNLYKRLNQSTLVIGLASIAWLIYRSGTKPSRIVYPCQRAAAVNSYTFLVYPFFAFFVNLTKNVVPRAYNKATRSRRGHLILLSTLLCFTILSLGLAAYFNIVFNPWSVIASRTTLTQKAAEVSVVQVENNDLDQSLRTALDYLGGIASIIPEGAKVLIKPNIVRPQSPPDTTDPAIVQALINIIKQRNPSVIWVGDGTGEGDTMTNFNLLGYSSIASIPGVELVDLNYGDIVDVPVPKGGYVFDSFKFNSKVVEADVFISLACMKTHNTAVVTLGMKNLVGISAGSVYSVQNSANHMQLHNAATQVGDTYLGGVIADLNSARKINLTIIDGRVAMEGEGPHDGDPVDLGLIIVGKDPVATDTVASTIMGFDAEKIPSLVLSAQKGLGTNDLHKIEVKGKTLEEVFHLFAPPEGFSSFLVVTGTQFLMYEWRVLLFLPSVIFALVTIFTLFRYMRSKGVEKPVLTASLANVQTELSEFQPVRLQEEKKITPLPEVTSKHLEDEINDNITTFQQYTEQIEETSIRLEEVTKLIKNGEIPQSAYDFIAEDLSKRLSASVEDLFVLRENLELIRAKATIEKSKNKEIINKESKAVKTIVAPKSEDLRYVRGYTDVIESNYWAETKAGLTVYSPSLGKWEGLILKIDSALFSLTMDKELSIIEQYLSFFNQNPSLITNHEQAEKAVSICKQRLTTVSEKWISTRRSRIEHIINLEADITSLKDQIIELDVRYSLGELTQAVFELENSKLQNKLTNLEKELLGIRSHIDDMDRIIFRSTELLQSGSQK
jgi:uncharacterized protein (DUF362 family)